MGKPRGESVRRRASRPNPIVVGCLILGASILGFEVNVIYHSGRHTRPSATALERQETSGPTSEAQEMPRPRPAAPDPTPPPESKPPAPVVLPAAGTEAIDGGSEVELWRRQALLAARRRQVILDADEQAFQTLNLPEATRAAVRAIDGNYVRTTLPLPAAVPNAAGAAQDPTGDPNAEQTRRAALEALLGPETARTFTLEERKAEHHLRNQLRAQWVRGR